MSQRFKILLIGNYTADKQTSMQRFASMLHHSLTELGQDVELLIPPKIIGRLYVSATGFGKWIGYLDKYVLFPFILRRRLKQLGAHTIVHICDHSNAFYTKHLQQTPHLVTCHDLFAVRSALGEFEQNRLRWSGIQQQAMILKGLKQSQGIVSISKATHDDVVRLVAPPVQATRIVPNAIQQIFLADQPPTSQRDKDLPSEVLNESYVLHIGNDSWYKNRAAVIRLYAALVQLNPKLKLYYVGPEFSEQDLAPVTGKIQDNQIQRFDRISDHELKQLYTHARMLLFPSIIEGFGWPIMEAQACGCPVATLNRPPMNELNQITELLLDTETDSEAWATTAAQQCDTILQSSADERQNLAKTLQSYSHQFTPSKAASEYCQIYSELAS